MKKIFLVLTTIVLVLIFSSCATVYRCNDPKPAKQPFTWSNRLKTVVNERDNLCSNLATKVKEKDGLKKNLADFTDQDNKLSASFKVLQDKYNTLRNALLGFNSDELSMEIRDGKVYVSMSDKLLFRSGSSAMEDKGREALKLLAGVLEKNSDIDILIEVHTDNVPIKTSVYKDNWDLSVARATSIVRILTNDYKIAPTRLTASGKGEFFPKADNNSTEGRAINLRTEIILSPKLDELMKLLKI